MPPASLPLPPTFSSRNEAWRQRERQNGKQRDKKGQRKRAVECKDKAVRSRRGKMSREECGRKRNERREEEEGGRVIRAVSWLRAQWKGGPQRRRGTALRECQPGALIPHNRFISQTVEALMRLTPQLHLPSERCQELGNDDAPRWKGAASDFHIHWQETCSKTQTQKLHVTGLQYTHSVTPPWGECMKGEKHTVHRAPN